MGRPFHTWGFQIHRLNPSWGKIIFQRNIRLLLKLWRTVWIIAPLQCLVVVLVLGVVWEGGGEVGRWVVTFPSSSSQGLQQGLPCCEPHGLFTPSSTPRGRSGGNAMWTPLAPGFGTVSFCSHSWKPWEWSVLFRVEREQRLWFSQPCSLLRSAARIRNHTGSYKWGLTVEPCGA